VFGDADRDEYAERGPREDIFEVGVRLNPVFISERAPAIVL
jgi:hypothetical protein